MTLVSLSDGQHLQGRFDKMQVGLYGKARLDLAMQRLMISSLGVSYCSIA